jgi:hypothetical protein
VPAADDVEFGWEFYQEVAEMKWSITFGRKIGANLGDFFASEDGLVTVEWVALAGALAIGAITVGWIVLNGLQSPASSIGANMSNCWSNSSPSGPC